ncbi:cytochrome P450 [Streptomyces sp. NPDC002513]
MAAVDNSPLTYPFGLSHQLEMHPEYERLRGERKLARVSMPYGGQAWLATRYDDIKAVLEDHRFSTAATLGRDVPRLMPLIETNPTILTTDPPDHTRLRKLVGSAFTARRVEQLRPIIQTMTDALLDRMIEQGPPADLVEGLAMPLSLGVICELLGVPLADRERFGVWCDGTLANPGFTPEEVEESRQNLFGYLAGLIAQRRAQPTDDLLGALVAARDSEDRLSELELITFGVALLVLGHETTANSIGNFTYNLLTHTAQLDRLLTDPELLNSAVEELLRFTPSLTAAAFPRIATEDIELGGVMVYAGEAVLVQAASANLDEQVFVDPDQLDLGRQHNPHLAFGYGVHYCTGAQLARVELQVAIGTLFRRLPGLQLAVEAGKVPWKQGRLLRGIKELPIAW